MTDLRIARRQGEVHREDDRSRPWHRRKDMKYLLLAMILSGCSINVEDRAAEPNTCAIEHLVSVDKYIDKCIRSNSASACHFCHESANGRKQP